MLERLGKTHARNSTDDETMKGDEKGEKEEKIKIIERAQLNVEWRQNNENEEEKINIWKDEMTTKCQAHVNTMAKKRRVGFAKNRQKKKSSRKNEAQTI